LELVEWLRLDGNLIEGIHYFLSLPSLLLLRRLSIDADRFFFVLHRPTQSRRRKSHGPKGPSIS